MVEKVKLFLDVDGVINHWPSDFPTEFPVKSATCMRYQITYHAPIWKELAALDVDITWLTTWCELANEWISPLINFPELPVLGSRKELEWDNSSWWKLDQIRDLNLTEPFIWIDDELGHYREYIYNTWDNIPPEHLFISPKGSFNNQDLDDVKKFLWDLKD